MKKIHLHPELAASEDLHGRRPPYRPYPVRPDQRRRQKFAYNRHVSAGRVTRVVGVEQSLLGGTGRAIAFSESEQVYRGRVESKEVANEYVGVRERALTREAQRSCVQYKLIQ